MIQGRVDGLQARVVLNIRLPNRPDAVVEFVIDTGFEGALTMPANIIADIGLPFFQEISAKLANDVTVRTDVHAARVVWGSDEIDVAVLAMGMRPLLGTSMLAGKEIVAQFINDGLVAIDQIQQFD